MAKTTFLFVRHGETDWNRNHRMQGSTDIPLNDFGISQAQSLNTHMQTFDVDTIYASPLSRARRTAELAYTHISKPMRFDDRIIERSFGEYEGLSFNEVITKHRAMEYPHSWDYPHYVPPKGESIEDVRRRMTHAFDDISRRHSGETISIVSHGAALTILITSLLNLPIKEARHIRLDNTSLSILTHTPEKGNNLEILNYTKHLDG